LPFSAILRTFFLVPDPFFQDPENEISFRNSGSFPEILKEVCMKSYAYTTSPRKQRFSRFLIVPSGRIDLSSELVFRKKPPVYVIAGGLLSCPERSRHIHSLSGCYSQQARDHDHRLPPVDKVPGQMSFVNTLKGQIRSICSRRT
jgi:hypothetical protein